MIAPISNVIDFASTLASARGLLGYLPTAVSFLQSYGHLLNDYEDTVIQSLLSRTSYTQDLSVPSREFAMPGRSLALVQNKWRLSQERGTKQCIADMFTLLGYPNGTIYRHSAVMGRWDWGDPPSGAAITLQPRYYPYLQYTYVPWFSVVLWGGFNFNTSTPWAAQVQGTTVSGTSGSLVKNAVSNPLAYTTSPDWRLLGDVCRYNEGAGELCAELIVTGYNTDEDAVSLFDTNGQPLTGTDMLAFEKIHLANMRITP